LLRAVLVALHGQRQALAPVRSAELHYVGAASEDDLAAAIARSLPGWRDRLAPWESWWDAADTEGLSDPDLDPWFSGRLWWSVPAAPDNGAGLESLWGNGAEKTAALGRPRAGHVLFIDEDGESRDLWPFVIATPRSIACLARWSCGGCHRFIELDSGTRRSLPGWAAGCILHDRFLAIDLRGSGQFADLLRAWDLWLKQDVALKCFRASPRDLDRFVREGEIGRRLDHPGIAKVLDIHPSGDRVSISQEYVVGRSIDERLRAGERFDPARTRVVTRQVLQVLSHAHANDVVHRDLTPKNVILGDSDRVTVVDFGLAFLADASVRLSQSSDSVGAPAFMPPEQIRGAVPDARSDLFAVGCLMVAMLTGRSPFETPSLSATYRRIMGGEPDLNPLRRRAPELVGLVSTLVATNPNRRPDSATATLRLLDALPASGSARTRPSWSIGATAAAVAIVLGTGAVVLTRSRTDQAPPRFTPPDRAVELASAFRRALEAAPPPSPLRRLRVLHDRGFDVDLIPGKSLVLVGPESVDTTRIACRGVRATAATGDFDGDSKLELVVVSSGEGVRDTIPPAATLIDGDGTELLRQVLVAPADLPGDPRAPLRVAALVTGELLENRTPEMAAEPVEIAFEAHHPVSHEGQISMLVRQPGSGLGIDWRQFRWTTSGHYHRLAIGDLNDDGLPELVAAGEEVLAGKRVSVVALRPEPASPGQLAPYRGRGERGRALWHTFLPFPASVQPVAIEEGAVMVRTSAGTAWLDGDTGILMSDLEWATGAGSGPAARSARIHGCQDLWATAEHALRGGDRQRAIELLRQARGTFGDLRCPRRGYQTECGQLAVLESRLAELQVGTDRGTTAVNRLLELWEGGWRDPGIGRVLPKLLNALGRHDSAVSLRLEIEGVDSTEDLSLGGSRLLWECGRETEALHTAARHLGEVPGSALVTTVPLRFLLESSAWDEAFQLATRQAQGSVLIGAQTIVELAAARLGKPPGTVSLSGTDALEARAWRMLRAGEADDAARMLSESLREDAIEYEAEDRTRLELLRAWALREAAGNSDAAIVAIAPIDSGAVRGRYWRSLHQALRRGDRQASPFPREITRRRDPWESLLRRP